MHGNCRNRENVCGLSPHSNQGSSDVDTLFSCIESIAELNFSLLNGLESLSSSWDDDQTCLGPLFIEFAPKLTLYSSYVNNFNAAIATLERNRRRGSFAAFVNKTMSQHPNADLPSLLITPVQRIPRYLLLLTDLLKHTWPEHVDHASLQQAVAAVKSAATAVNESGRAAEEDEKMQAVLELFTGRVPEIVRDGRTFRHRGLIKRMSSITVQKREMLLFSDCLMFAGHVLGSSRSLRHLLTVPLDTAWVRSLPDCDDFENALQIVTPTHTYTIYTEEEHEKTQWLQMLNHVIDALVDADPTLIGHRGSVRMEESVGLFTFFSSSAQQIDPDAFAAAELERNVNVYPNPCYTPSPFVANANLARRRSTIFTSGDDARRESVLSARAVVTHRAKSRAPAVISVTEGFAAAMGAVLPFTPLTTIAVERMVDSSASTPLVEQSESVINFDEFASPSAQAEIVSEVSPLPNLGDEDLAHLAARVAEFTSTPKPFRIGSMSAHELDDDEAAAEAWFLCSPQSPPSRRSVKALSDVRQALCADIVDTLCIAQDCFDEEVDENVLLELAHELQR
eukprot:TRINITY_DN1118_c1_g1_i2.p1 TRINITY_DN1118_c1_g1~~TRINITY_DN1118_c1_g1_i2.p1  ORF type:complete len:566 (-),score=105.47 TRINITY_DN1118_c1_g1_i2:112-1809(-)